MKLAMVVDDEEAVAKALHFYFRHALPSAWAVEHLTDPQLALSRLIVDDDIQLAVVDILMPGLDGVTLIEQALRHRPDLRGRIIVCSGGVISREDEELLFDVLGCKRLDKPPHLSDIEALVWSIITP